MADRRRYTVVQLDVFTERPLEGNQLAVFTDATGLSDNAMQALAREMNFSETTFVVPREPAVEREKGVRVRIFTVQEELPFAGHPTLGTALALRGADITAPKEITLDLNVGPIPVTFEDMGNGKVFAEMRQRDPEFGRIHHPEEVANALGLNMRDLDPALPIQTVSTGLPFAIVPLRSTTALGKISTDLWPKMADYLRHSDAPFFYFVAPAGSSRKEPHLRARMIFYNGEDPATGSAAGTAAAWFVKHGVAKPGERVLIEQGVEMKRPSKIFVRADLEKGRVTNVRVGGHAVEVLRGEVAL